MNIIPKEELEKLYTALNPKLDLTAIISVDDEEISRLLNYTLFLEQCVEEIVNSSSFTHETILYSQYYWFVYFKNNYFLKYGYDAGMDDQVILLIENLTYELGDQVDWELIEKIHNELKIN
ncbi:hypothetical protein A8F94_13025 [Bacillus sp. FJAT-27225]|uniref:hypothetical protein n=1 Tax=Bacillus sp. FJAT-27225 TaxID=1743144 RepID=UPI00080C270B|nr:hypothetical protein [Bacillus sp. FJAT-27225]OCA85789.1 hypothetical protein A8F94_13025 [Bacillus sp. FJAT-27225]